jgi:hypothetical protein
VAFTVLRVFTASFTVCSWAANKKKRLLFNNVPYLCKHSPLTLWQIQGGGYPCSYHIFNTYLVHLSFVPTWALALLDALALVKDMRPLAAATLMAHTSLWVQFTLYNLASNCQFFTSGHTATVRFTHFAFACFIFLSRWAFLTCRKIPVRLWGDNSGQPTV